MTIQEIPGLWLDYRSGYHGPPPGNGSVQGSGNSAGSGSAPVVLHRVDPEYSEEARSAKYQGTVLLDVEIDATGKVTGMQVSRSLGLGLDEKAIEAVRQWRFRPEIRDGRTLASEAKVAARFRLL